jgi:cytochrome b
MSTEMNTAPRGNGARALASALEIETEAGAEAAPGIIERRLVWDLPLRAFHWLFAASILASWATAKAGFTWMQWHIRLGYWMMGLIIFRVVWGVIGPRHARFTSFLKGPGAVWRYVRGFTGLGEAVESVGHNPLGGLMVILMLLLVAFQTGTGLFTTDDISWSGPFNAAVSGSTGHLLTSLHHLNFNFIWAAIALHVGAIAYYAFIKRQNLVPAMLHGWKPAEAVPAGEAITSSQLWKALIVMIVAAGLVYWILTLAPPPPAANSFDLNLD